jgi:hypothetical protein
VAIIVYRYDDEHYPDGMIISSRGDHFNRLTATQQQVELAIRRRLGKDCRDRKVSMAMIAVAASKSLKT